MIIKLLAIHLIGQCTQTRLRISSLQQNFLAITHDKRLLNVDKELERFFDAMGPLENKTLTLLLQLPASIQTFTGLERLRKLVPKLDPRFKYATAVRHPSWFQDLSYSFFANRARYCEYF